MQKFARMIKQDTYKYFSTHKDQNISQELNIINLTILLDQLYHMLSHPQVHKFSAEFSIKKFNALVDNIQN